MHDDTVIPGLDHIDLMCRSGFKERLDKTAAALGMPAPDLVEMLVDSIHGQLRTAGKVGTASLDGEPLESQGGLVAKWKIERTRRMPGGHLFIATGYNDFSAYAKSKGVEPISRELFAEKLGLAGFRRKRVNAGSIILGRALLG